MAEVVDLNQSFFLHRKTLAHFAQTDQTTTTDAPSDVYFWHKADIMTVPIYVRLGVKRTWRGRTPISAFDPKRTSEAKAIEAQEHVAGARSKSSSDPKTAG